MSPLLAIRGSSGKVVVEQVDRLLSARTCCVNPKARLRQCFNYSDRDRYSQLVPTLLVTPPYHNHGCLFRSRSRPHAETLYNISLHFRAIISSRLYHYHPLVRLNDVRKLRPWFPERADTRPTLYHGCIFSFAAAHTAMPSPASAPVCTLPAKVVDNFSEVFG